MTYEEKLLQVFSRFRGEAFDETTLSKMEQSCEDEVWSLLPDGVRHSWKLKLGFGDTGQIELRPHQIGSVPAETLEATLRGPIQATPSSGGIMGFSLNFQDAPQEQKSTAAAVIVTSTSPLAPSTPVARAEPGAPSSSSVAATVEAQAKDLGIALPPNSSLLQPFLEALQAAAEYKARALSAESQLARLKQG